jgi:regulator of cell morphogenesis and NO signaling
MGQTQPGNEMAQDQANEASSSKCDGRDWEQAPLVDLIDHIVAKHHRTTREALSAIGDAIAEALATCGRGTPGLDKLRRTFAELQNDLVFHLLKEENELFPWIKHVPGSTQALLRPRRNLADLIRLLEHEHAGGNELLDRAIELANQLGVPPAAGPIRQTIIECLTRLETDLQQHVYEEDKILFPRAIADKTAK